MSKNIAPLIACIFGAICWALAVHIKYNRKHNHTGYEGEEWSTSGEQKKVTKEDGIYDFLGGMATFVGKGVIISLGIMILSFAFILKLLGYFTQDVGFGMVMSLLLLTIIWLILSRKK